MKEDTEQRLTCSGPGAGLVRRSSACPISLVSAATRPERASCYFELPGCLTLFLTVKDLIRVVEVVGIAVPNSELSECHRRMLCSDALAYGSTCHKWKEQCVCSRMPRWTTLGPTTGRQAQWKAVPCAYPRVSRLFSYLFCSLTKLLRLDGKSRLCHPSIQVFPHCRDYEVSKWFKLQHSEYRICSSYTSTCCMNTTMPPLRQADVEGAGILLTSVVRSPPPPRPLIHSSFSGLTSTLACS